MRSWLVALMVMAVAACSGGGEPARSGPNDLAAQACEEAAKSRLSGKPYQLDFAALSASMKPQPGGEKFLTAPILIEPGLTSEVKQIVECTVRFTEGNPNPDVVGFVFNW
jgi:hypothetical protein